MDKQSTSTFPSKEFALSNEERREIEDALPKMGESESVWTSVRGSTLRKLYAADRERRYATASVAPVEARLREALKQIERLLTNLQPHIVQACYPEKVPFIDNYVDPALEAARAALADGEKDRG